MKKIKWYTYLKILLFLMIFVFIVINPKNILDIILADIIRDFLGAKVFVYLGKGISYLFHDKLLLLIMGILGVFLFYIKEYKKSIFILSTAFFGSVIAILIKNLVHRPRPLDIYDGYSFPSGHSTVVMLFFASLLFIINKKDVVRLIGKIAIFLVPLSRVVIGAHYVSDVVAGLLIGSIVVDLVKIYYIKIYEIFSNITGVEDVKK